ncbi:MAG TPA: ScpA family protein, partial [Gammaproteobacteria bacterium]|nr:ScpA family protein [Gammaproteobacteria bacterium]
MAAEAPEQTAAADDETVAKVHGEPLVQLPDDLYIPPEALEVFLDSFEGPLDLLLYLIRRHRLDISAISIQAVAHQYMEYVELMRQSRLDLAGEYLVMAATLAEMKSRILLPRPATDDDEEEEDPRTELIRRLQEYERFKEAAESLDRLPRQERDFFVAGAPMDPEAETPKAEASLLDMLEAFRGVLARGELQQDHQVGAQGLTVRQRMTEILHKIDGGTAFRFTELLNPTEGRE